MWVVISHARHARLGPLCGQRGGHPPPRRLVSDRRGVGGRPPRRRGATAAGAAAPRRRDDSRSEEHTSELQSLAYLVCRLLLEKKKTKDRRTHLGYDSSRIASHKKLELPAVMR